MGQTDFEVWPISEEFRTGTRTRTVRAWHAIEAANFYVRDYVDPGSALDWLILGDSFAVFVREPFTGQQTRYLVTRSVRYEVSPPVAA